MTKSMNITDPLIQELIAEVAPLVEEATGWDLNLPGLRSRVLQRDRGYEEILLGRIRGAGAEVPDEATHGLLERLIEYILESNILAAYEPSRQEILVIRENVDESNLDGLRLIIAHELVHRTQHIRHPELFDQVDEGIREVFELIVESGNFLKAIERMKPIQPVMTLLESHAHYVHEMLHRTRFPNARIEAHFNLPALLLRLLGAKKISQYTDGIPEVTEAMSHGGMDALYAKTEQTKG